MTRLPRRPVIAMVAMVAFFMVLTSPAFAQTKEAGSNDRSPAARAVRIMQTIDTDGNGTFEKSEDAAVWKRFQRFDADRDGVITVQELQNDRPRYLSTTGRRKLDVIYKRTPQGALQLDLYYPPGTDQHAALPVVIYTHGGGWAAGSRHGISKGSFAAVFQELLKNGFAAATVDYRLCRPNNGVTIRDCVIDCFDATRYLAKHSQSLQLDSQRFFVMGDSAGGHLAQMLLLCSPDRFSGVPELADASYRMVAGVSWYGPCDFEKIELFNHDNRPDFRDRFQGRILGENFDPATKPNRYREISPVNYLKKNSPPLLMIQGDRDTTIPVMHAEYMRQKAAAVGAPVQIMIVRNAGHNWRKVGADIDPPRQTIIKRTVRFLADHLPK